MELPDLDRQMTAVETLFMFYNIRRCIRTFGEKITREIIKEAFKQEK